MAQLSPAVRAARVHAAIVEQEEGVDPAAGHVPQPPATEHVAPPGLKGGVRLPGDAQLPVLGVTPAQHCRLEGVRKGEHLSEGSGRSEAAHTMGRPKTRLRLDGSPASSSSRRCRPWEESRERVSDPICHDLPSLSRRCVFQGWKLKKGLGVGVAV